MKLRQYLNEEKIFLSTRKTKDGKIIVVTDIFKRKKLPDVERGWIINPKVITQSIYLQHPSIKKWNSETGEVIVGGVLLSNDPKNFLRKILKALKLKVEEL